MKKISFYALFIVFFIFLGLIAFCLIQSNNIPLHSEEKDFKKRENLEIKTSSNTQIITINNNYELNQTATSGNGTLSNPYIIEDKIINGNGSLYCILINNTDKFFILKSCILFNSTYGLYLNNVSNGYIMVNFVYENLIIGIYIENSFNNTVLGNSIYDNENHGILLENANFTNIKSNSLLNNNITGIYLNNSLYNNITANTVNYHNYPVFLHSSNNTFLINNTGTGNKNDIKELNCDETNYFEGNNFKEIINSRGEKDNNNDSNIKPIIIDFTLILIVCTSVFIIALLGEKILKRFLSN